MNFAFQAWLHTITHYNVDISGAAFSIGQRVRILPDDSLKIPAGYVVGIVLGVHWAEGETESGAEGEFEYAISDVGALLWEHELRAEDH